MAMDMDMDILMAIIMVIIMATIIMAITVMAIIQLTAAGMGCLGIPVADDDIEDNFIGSAMNHTNKLVFIIIHGIIPISY